MVKPVTELVELKVSLLTHRDEYIVFRFPGGYALQFAPGSQVYKVVRNPSGYDSIWIPAWLAKKRRWIS